MRACPSCGKNLDLVGARHRCVTHIEPVVTHAADTVTHTSSGAERQKRWRESHRDEALAKQRERMRRKRKGS